MGEFVWGRGGVYRGQFTVVRLIPWNYLNVLSSSGRNCCQRSISRQSCVETKLRS